MRLTVAVDKKDIIILLKYFNKMKQRQEAKFCFVEDTCNKALRGVAASSNNENPATSAGIHTVFILHRIAGYCYVE